MSTGKTASTLDQPRGGLGLPSAAKLSAEQQAWLKENQQAIEEYNRWMEAGQDPFAAFRRL